MSKHNFIESKSYGTKYDVVIYCTWCGLVVWDFNRTADSINKLQQKVGKPCVHEEQKNG